MLRWMRGKEILCVELVELKTQASFPLGFFKEIIRCKVSN